MDYSSVFTDRKLYGKDDARSIIGACANQIYLLTIEYETAEMYSKLIGNETITVRSRSGDPSLITLTQFDKFKIALDMFT